MVIVLLIMKVNDMMSILIIVIMPGEPVVIFLKQWFNIIWPFTLIRFLFISLMFIFVNTHYCYSFIIEGSVVILGLC